MGQKVDPHGLTVGVTKDWESIWYAEGYDENMIFEDHTHVGECRKSHKSKAKAKNALYSFAYSAVKQFIRAVKQSVARRLILTRQNC